MMRSKFSVPFLVLVLLVACSRSPSIEERTLELQIGTHSISVVSPLEWEHLDYGERHHFRRGFERISIEEFGFLGVDLDQSADSALVLLREDDRRSVATRGRTRVFDRDAVAIDTWDRLSHQFRKRYVFVDDGDMLLGIYMMTGEFEAMESTFAEVVASITFADSLVSTR